jgi:hypothetical protein
VISPGDHEKLLRNCDLGYSTAEDDEEKLSLPESRILVPAFYDILDDRIDHVRGVRGSGKSALLFILKNYLESPKSRYQGIFCVAVVPPHDNPVLWQVQEQLNGLSQADLNNFWSLYLIAEAARAFETAVSSDARFREVCGAAESFSKKLDKLLKGPALGTRVTSWLRRVLRIQIGIEPSPIGPLPTTLGIEFREGPSNKETMRLIRVAQKGVRTRELIEDLKARLAGMLEVTGVRIWLLFDGLDRCFPRRTDLEREAILSLLRCSYHLGSRSLRVKLFVRDDILRDLSGSCGGFSDFPMITDRMSPPLRWGPEDILRLILRRVFSNSYLAGYFSVSYPRLEGDPEYRELLLLLLISQVEEEGDVLSTFRWIVRQCSTANGEATPRDVIKFFKLARDKALYLSGEDIPKCNCLLPEAALHYAAHEISLHKTEAYLNNDFADLREFTDFFRNGPTKLSRVQMKDLLGEDWQVIASTLEDIGFLGYENGASGQYAIGPVFRRALNVH